MPETYSCELDTHAEEQVILGIRPEHITVAHEDVSHDSCFASRLEVVEQLGEEVILNVHVGNTPIKVSHVSPDFSLPRGQTLQLRPNSEHLHFFSAGTGLVLSHGHGN